MRAPKFLMIAGITFLLAGCKLAVIVVEGGEVQSIGSGICVASTICIVDVTDPSFSESFTAVPDQGWYFEKWQKGERFFCGGSKYPECTLSFEGHEDKDEIQEIVATSETFYLMPIFKEGVRFVEVDGKDWLQPLDFRGYGYDQVAAVCSPNSGLCSGYIAGSSIDLTGYYWASSADVDTLFIAYGGEPPFDPTNDNVDAAVEFCQDFISSNSRTEEYINGYLRDRNPSNAPREYYQAIVACGAGFWGSLPSNGSSGESVGAWFWREAER